MSSRNTVVRSLHDLGAAAWFGGSLMGAVGVNGAADAVRDSQDRARVAAVGWAKWTPVSAAAIGAHLIGGGAILYANRDRAKHQSGVTANISRRSCSPELRSALLQRDSRRQDGNGRRALREKERPNHHRPRPMTSPPRRSNFATCSGRSRCSPEQSSCLAPNRASSSVPGRFSPALEARWHDECATDGLDQSIRTPRQEPRDAPGPSRPSQGQLIVMLFLLLGEEPDD